VAGATVAVPVAVNPADYSEPCVYTQGFPSGCCRLRFPLFRAAP